MITLPNLNKSGGVSSLFNILKLDQYKGIKYFEVSKYRKYHSSNRMRRIIELFSIYVDFFMQLYKFEIVHVNPSMGKKSFFRDGLFIMLARIKNKKTLVYWHGWNSNFEKKVEQNRLLNYYFKKSFLKADIHVVLGNVFKTSLVNLGIDKNSIRIESNAADDSYLKNNNQLVKPLSIGNEINLLFIARIEKEKGIYIAIDTIQKIQMLTDLPICLEIAGNGLEFSNAINYVKDKGIKNIKFIGEVCDQSKHEAFCRSDILFFPTYYPEGMPIVIIEGMLYGLPIISRPVGGIPDWVLQATNGFLLESMDPNDFAIKIIELLNSPTLLRKVSENNSKRGMEYFTPDAVTKRLYSYYQQLYSNY